MGWLQAASANTTDRQNEHVKKPTYLMLLGNFHRRQERGVKLLIKLNATQKRRKMERGQSVGSEMCGCMKNLLSKRSERATKDSELQCIVTSGGLKEEIAFPRCSEQPVTMFAASALLEAAGSEIRFTETRIKRLLKSKWCISHFCARCEFIPYHAFSGLD